MKGIDKLMAGTADALTQATRASELIYDAIYDAVDCMLVFQASAPLEGATLTLKGGQDLVLTLPDGTALPMAKPDDALIKRLSACGGQVLCLRSSPSLKQRATPFELPYVIGE